eukprot:7579697-Pyramimonas_sp.AAC.1
MAAFGLHGPSPGPRDRPRTARQSVLGQFSSAIDRQFDQLEASAGGKSEGAGLLGRLGSPPAF